MRRLWSMLWMVAGTSSVLFIGAVSGRGGENPEGGNGGDADYSGHQACVVCHIDFARQWEKIPHSQILLASGRKAEDEGCEACHGPGGSHASSRENRARIVRPDQLPLEASWKLCLRCHAPRVTWERWRETAHADVGMKCWDCHKTHRVTRHKKMLEVPVNDLCFSCHPDKRAQFQQVAHHPLLEGRLTCVDCHDPMGSGREKMVREGTGGALVSSTNDMNDLCLSCHPEKAGPFFFEHDPVSGGLSGGCLTCHDPHGSPNDKLLRISGRGICLQCHTDQVGHFPGQYCVRCHQTIHGSDTNELFFP